MSTDSEEVKTSIPYTDRSPSLESGEEEELPLSTTNKKAYDSNATTDAQSNAPVAETDASGLKAREQISSEASAKSQPPLPQEDDGWEPCWDESQQSWYFFNRYTQKSQWDNPRVTKPAIPAAPGTVPLSSESHSLPSPASTKPKLGGYNPAIHGDYDPNADYARDYESEDEQSSMPPIPATSVLSSEYSQTAQFNRFTGKFQTDEQDASRHSDAAKSKRQLNAYFNVDEAANSHDGRSLKAERQAKNFTKGQLKEFKEKRRAKKEEKRRAWLRD